MRAPERDLYLFQVLEDVRARMEELHIEAEVTGERNTCTASTRR